MATAHLTLVSSPQLNSWLGALAESSGGVPANPKPQLEAGEESNQNNFTCTGAQVHVAYLKVIVDIGCVIFQRCARTRSLGHTGRPPQEFQSWSKTLEESSRFPFRN